MKKKDYVLIAILIALDQLSKYYFSHQISLGERVAVLDNFFYLTYVQNTGAAWSLLEGFGPLFTCMAVIVSILICVFFQKNKVNVFEKTAGVLIIAGALGNAIDRLFFNYVIDFLDFYIFGYDFPVFNVADICITIAAGLLILDVIVSKEEK